MGRNETELAKWLAGQSSSLATLRVSTPTVVGVLSGALKLKQNMAMSSSIAATLVEVPSTKETVSRSRLRRTMGNHGRLLCMSVNDGRSDLFQVAPPSTLWEAVREHSSLLDSHPQV